MAATPETEYKTSTYRLPMDLFNAIEELAHKNHRSVSGEVRLAVQKHVEAANAIEARSDGHQDGANVLA